MSIFFLKNDALTIFNCTDFWIRYVGTIYVSNKEYSTVLATRCLFHVWYDRLCVATDQQVPSWLIRADGSSNPRCWKKTFDHVSSLEQIADGEGNRKILLPDNMARTSRMNFTSNLLTSEQTRWIWNGTGRDPPKLDKITISRRKMLISNVGISVQVVRYHAPDN